MFQHLDRLITGSFYILTGLPGVGKSHLAATARSHGTVWVVDTEGAAQTLRNKPGIHADLRVVQTLSLRELLVALQEVKRLGKRGDTIILDSISKAVQAMRSYAQQRAGADTNRKASLAYDEHASVNRNLQTIYTALTELKHAGFHIILIGHLAKKYRSSGNALTSDGVRVLADENIIYEADAVLLVELNGTTRTVKPILKEPRPAHLKREQSYPATLATLFPVLAVAPDAATTTTTASPASGKITQFPAPATAQTASRPKTPAEAEQRFYTRYGELIGGTTWAAVQAFLGYESDQPTTIDEWLDLAREIRVQPPGADTAVA